MTQTLPTAPRRAPAPFALSRLRRALRCAALAACVPYLSLKVAWIAGSRPGIPEGSTLLDHRALMIFANGLTVLMDGAVVVLVLLLTRPWGTRTPARFLVPPMWAATGLLVPIMAGFPLTQLVRAFDGGLGGGSGDGGGAAEPFLDEWVFGVVYTGFIVQGIALGCLFVLYARDRWGHLWRGRLGDLPRGHGRARRATALAAALLALCPAALHLLWATGATTGLSAARIEERGTDFAVLEALNALYLAVAVAGGLLLACGWRPALPVKVPLALAWLGSGAVGCWGGWLLFGALTTLGDSTGRPTGTMFLTYAVHVIIGTLVAVVAARFLAERARASAAGSGDGA
ncbi:hypothetical protein DCW30_33800 [Streptomyces alfalfae]|uniref:Uncharacterized protein n=1 Tax=Streptomyces alfalfae TaxID=1642299 RepID=A0ABM6H017_9ACTN|nr:hypothetical protein [Streptomyces alfalfae]AYA19370.1 hypothetical protein D3X13_26735 [Streptomyces fradiae]APY88952.1 hypothetical protein A7J05_27555 [Streptomyces alfalfae]QUI31104.1 hypothetical protein H9W91_09735 [Streptomyces alfalfae]RXX35637.1 hypothetical protein DCW30_33800 [Streptomyces alfalfae]RZM81562.1 hypothetical protein D4104_34535 [Streptomyces alfalfae]